MKSKVSFLMSGIAFFTLDFLSITGYFCCMTDVRVRFAPSPTGGLHLGGVRTALYNYLFARHNRGSFILRVEDTDQTRYVDGAEAYIFNCLRWCGIEPDESVESPGDFGPYRQSERKEIYKKYIDKLIAKGHAYYAFDTPEELDMMREQLKSEGSDSLQYDHNVRLKMKNSLSRTQNEVEDLLAASVPYVVRIKINPNEQISFADAIRGDITFDSSMVDDKVLLKADGMPTYHLAVVVDDFLMKITHAFRGEEWLASAPVHILLWNYLFGMKAMPQWAHLPLILKPDGHGKLSKRDGERLGFPVYAMDWKNADGSIAEGFKEQGFLPEAFINMLAVLGWNDGSEQEIFTLEELVEKFSLERVHSSGAKFDFEKAKWYNHEWIKRLPAIHFAERVAAIFKTQKIIVGDRDRFIEILDLVKDRCPLLTDFVQQAGYFYKSPGNIDTNSITPKWNEGKMNFFKKLLLEFEAAKTFTAAHIEEKFKALATAENIKPGELQLPFRVMLVGGKFGPAVFDIASRIGKEETKKRITAGLTWMAEK